MSSLSARVCKVALFSNQENAAPLRDHLKGLTSENPWFQIVEPDSVRTSTLGELVIGVVDSDAAGSWPWLASAGYFADQVPLPAAMRLEDIAVVGEWVLRLGRVHLERTALRRLMDRFEERIKKDSGRVRMADLLQEANVRLQEQSVRDGLTGIPNRRRFEEQFDYLWGRAAGEGAPITLILSDIDFFKKLNDALGHQEGDRCLQTVARRMHDLIEGEDDLVARYGGEEFVILLWNADEETADEVAELLRTSVRELGIPHPQHPAGRVTISLGVACATPGLTSSAEDFLHHADSLLYEAKSAGRDCWKRRPFLPV